MLSVAPLYGLVHHAILDGAMTGDIFHGYIEDVLGEIEQKYPGQTVPKPTTVIIAFNDPPPIGGNWGGVIGTREKCWGDLGTQN